MPQVQSITLTEREEFLVQSQERSGGIVVYTGMNNNGDSFIGNRKTSSSTGEEVTFDNPIPTITGEDPSRLSAVFDEVTVKERLVVEGGNSGTILSQFDGPVTFNKEVKFTDAVNVRSQLKVSDTTQSTTTANGALIVSGGVGIAKNLNVGGNLNVTGSITGNVTGNIVGDVTGTATNATNISIAATTSSDTTTSIVLVANQSTGNQSPFIDSGLSYNANTNALTASTFVGTLSNLLTLNTSGTGLSGSTSYNNSGAATFTVTSNATSANTASTIVARDASNNFNAGTITAALTGNATSASTAADLSFGSANQVVFKNGSNNGATSSNLTFDGTNLSVGGDITAFASDERLKENIQPLENALDKVLALNGFTYSFNEIGQSLGFDGLVRYVGVSAQQVQAVLPEAVKPAPVDSNYITVQYEKLVPLLIEAIKELKAEINELKGVK